MQSTLLFALVLVATSALSMFAVLMIVGAFRSATSGNALTATSRGDPAFLFVDEALVDANPRARSLIDGFPRADEHQEQSDFQALSRFLSRDFPDLEHVISQLSVGDHITLPAQNSAANLELIAERSAQTLRIVLVDTLAEDGVVTLDRLSYRAMQEELMLLRRLIDTAPFMLWREGPKGQVTWANSAYLQRVSAASDLMTWPLPSLFPSIEGGASQRICLSDPSNQTRQNWFDVSHVPDEEGRLAFALPADEAQQAERTKRDFIQTLTKTFATLPTGLAVFDRARRLQMFNPALTDLTGLETEFLLSRPGLEGFLNRMRDKRILPEPRDYRSWARRLLDIETAAPLGEFEETWTLPSGQTFRVSTNPHPDGALAFLIEDITSETHLTRNIRAEMETSQSVLNQIDAAIAVFSTNGQLVLTNSAFSRLWTLEGEETLNAVTLPEAIENWREASDSPSLWSDINALVQHRGGPATPVSGDMILADGERLLVDARRTTTGALMISFSQNGQTQAAPKIDSRAAQRAQIIRASA